MAERFGAGSDQLPGLQYVSNQGPQLPSPSYTPIPCNTAAVNNRDGSPQSGYPDPSGADPVTTIREFAAGMAR